MTATTSETSSDSVPQKDRAAELLAPVPEPPARDHVVAGQLRLGAVDRRRGDQLWAITSMSAAEHDDHAERAERAPVPRPFELVESGANRIGLVSSATAVARRPSRFHSRQGERVLIDAASTQGGVRVPCGHDRRDCTSEAGIDGSGPRGRMYDDRCVAGLRSLGPWPPPARNPRSAVGARVRSRSTARPPSRAATTGPARSIVVPSPAPTSRCGAPPPGAARAAARDGRPVADRGPEFAILLPEAARRTRELARDLVALARDAGRRAAAGVACFPEAVHRPAGGLLADADTALARPTAGTRPSRCSTPAVPQPAPAGLAGGAAPPRARRRRIVLDRALVGTFSRGPTTTCSSRACAAPDGAEGLLDSAERFGLGSALDR